ncbi:hypothetical protein B0H11DRAFT_2008854 [Mycena galericulata]|nr:hypothetical protein B0H11DRAFT_2008854 [Mycena galericulata]
MLSVFLQAIQLLSLSDLGAKPGLRAHSSQTVLTSKNHCFCSAPLDEIFPREKRARSIVAGISSPLDPSSVALCGDHDMSETLHTRCILRLSFGCTGSTAIWF